MVFRPIVVLHEQFPQTPNYHKMISQLLKHSLRALTRQKVFVAINIAGLAIGIASSLIIAIFIFHELSYDQYHEKKDQIYQLVLHGVISGEEFKGGYTSPPFGPAMAEEFPEVEGFLRINNFDETVIKYNDSYFIENHFLEADSSFFDFFSINLIRGNHETVLNEPHTVVISQSTAEKMFGSEDPIDRMIRVGTYPNEHRITGIMEDVPANTHFEASMVGSFMTNARANDQNWFSNSFATYVMLHPMANPQAINERIHDLLFKYAGPDQRSWMESFLQQGNQYDVFLHPLTKIYHAPDIQQSLKSPRDPRYLKIFGAIGLLILTIAAINFMNLATAQAGKRTREVGVKKVSGSSRGLLISQFLTETILLSVMAMIIAIVLSEIALPQLNSLLNMELATDYLSSWYIIPLLLLLAVVIGIGAGAYPAFYLSSFSPVRVLKGKQNSKGDHINLRRILTALQFSISIILIVGTLVMQRQISFMLNKELGFDKEHVMVIRRASVLGTQTDAFKNELLGIPAVLSVSASTAVPGHGNNNNVHYIEGRQDETYLLQTNWVDYDYLETYGIQLAEGRFFDREMLTDRQACLINERAARNFLLENPLEERFQESDDNRTTTPIIGVVKDYHFESLRNEIRPSTLKFKNENMNWGYISIRMAPGMARPVIDQIEDKWKSFTANEPLLFFFMDQDFERLYREEKQNAALSIIFTILAIIIASLGLYGLTNFTVLQKTKEIGVRKTFGASKTDIWLIVAREIMILLAISTAIAWPLIYWVAENWLQNYHYRISLNPLDFIKGLAVASAIALITISYRTLKAASVNPSISLRYE